MAKTSELELVAAGSSDAVADFVPVVLGADLENRRMTIQALVSRGLSGNLALVAPTQIDGQGTHDFVVQDAAQLSVEGTNAAVTGIQDLWIDSADLTLRGTGAFKMRTPRVHDGLGRLNSALMLVDTDEGGVEFSDILTLDNILRGWAASQSFTFTTATRDADGVIVTAEVAWPDGSAGTYTVTVKNATHLAVDAYTVTHTNTGKTVTQAAVTRDASGHITAQPSLTIA